VLTLLALCTPFVLFFFLFLLQPRRVLSEEEQACMYECVYGYV
jgi:uncharacterized protein YpmS